ncbi:MAG: VCBS repeat-containing protein [Spirochaetales bacterium]|nr:VCBS repeat-containing protein [Spirochaetales bacterium]
MDQRNRVCKNTVFFFFLLIFYTVTSGYASDVVRDFGFSCREVYTFHANTDQLTIVDMNGDGVDDIVFADNGISRIELLIRKKGVAVSEVQKTVEESFINRGFVVDQIVKKMVCTDLDNDNLIDIINIGKPFGLLILYQDKDGSFGPPVKPYLGRDIDFIGCEVRDLNNDSKPEIILARRNNIEILWNEEKDSFKKRILIPFSDSTCTFMRTGEFTGDAYADLLLSFSNTELPVKIRPGTKNGTFGWEIPLDIGSAYYIDAIDSDKGGHHDIGIILKNNRVFRLYRLSDVPAADFFDREELLPETLPFHGRLAGENSWMLADINEDSKKDMIVSIPEYSQLHIYYGMEKGFKEEPFIVDSLSGVEKLLLDEDGNIVCYSGSEDKLACHFKRKIIGFPQILELPDTPTAVTSYGESVYCLFKGKRTREFTLSELSWRTDGSIRTRTDSTVTLSGTPSDMLFYKVDAGTTGIVFFIPYNSPEVYHFNGDTLKHIESSELKNLSKKTTPAQILPMYEQSVCKLIICEDRIAREYRWNGSGYTITCQFNPSVETAHLVSVCRYPGKNGKDGYLFFDRSSQTLFWFPDDSMNGKPLMLHVNGDIDDLYGFTAANGTSGKGLLFVDRNGMHLLHDRAKSTIPVLKAEYGSQAENPFLWFFSSLRVGNIDKSGRKERKMIGLLDRKNRALEIVEKTGETLEKRLGFEIYQVSSMIESSLGSGFEPHGCASGDIDGDRIADLVVLVHDKLIVYYGE